MQHKKKSRYLAKSACSYSPAQPQSQDGTRVLKTTAYVYNNASRSPRVVLFGYGHHSVNSRDHLSRPMNRGKATAPHPSTWNQKENTVTVFYREGFSLVEAFAA